MDGSGENPWKRTNEMHENCHSYKEEMEGNLTRTKHTHAQRYTTIHNNISVCAWEKKPSVYACVGLSVCLFAVKCVNVCCCAQCGIVLQTQKKQKQQREETEEKKHEKSSPVK